MIPCSWVDWHPQKLVRSFFMDVPVSSSSIELPMSMKMRSQWFTELISTYLETNQLGINSSFLPLNHLIERQRQELDYDYPLRAGDKWDVGNEIEFYTFVRSDRKFQKNKNPPHFIIFLSSAVQLFLTRPMLFLSNIKGNIIIACSNWKSPVRMHPW